MSTKEAWISVTVSVLLLGISNNALALSTSTNFRIWADSVTSGGNRSTSTNFIAEDSISETATVEESVSTNFLLAAGLPALFEEPVLRMTISSATASFSPNISNTAVSSASYTVITATNADSGYTLSITEDGALRSGGNSIGDVSDGAVSAGSSETGVAVSGTGAAFADDRAVSETALVLATSSSRTTGTTNTITHKASITTGTPPGTYSHVVTLVVTSNY